MRALDNLKWRIENALKTKKPIRVTEKVIQDYNNIEAFVKRAESGLFEANYLFAKLFVWTYMRELEASKATILDNIVRDRLYTVLRMPYEQLVEQFTKSLNESGLYALMEDVGVSAKCPGLQTKDEIKEDTEKILSHENGKAYLMGEVWEKDEVETCLKREIIQAVDVAIAQVEKIKNEETNPST